MEKTPNRAALPLNHKTPAQVLVAAYTEMRGGGQPLRHPENIDARRVQDRNRRCS